MRTSDDYCDVRPHRLDLLGRPALHPLAAVALLDQRAGELPPDDPRIAAMRGLARQWLNTWLTTEFDVYAPATDDDLKAMDDSS